MQLLNRYEELSVGLERFAKVGTDQKYGVILKIRDPEIATQFEQYMLANCFVHFVVQNEEGAVNFLFGEVASESKVQDIYLRFSRTAVAH
ncbi:MAG: hypothetical protein V4603_07375 [Pseudomonadota bacterium]